MSEPPDPNSAFATEGAKALAMARFHGGLAHDLNNRLTTILGNLILFESLYPNEKEALVDMRHAAEQACDLVRLVQTFQKRDVLPPHPVSVKACLETLQDLLQRLMGPSPQLSMLLPDDPVYLSGDEGTLESLLVDLIGLSAAVERMQLAVSVKDQTVEILCGGGVRAPDSVSAPDMLSALNGSYEVVEGGWRLRFPACDPESALKPEPPLPATGIRLLLAEGDPRLREYLAGHLRENGFDVTDVADVLAVKSVLAGGAGFDVAALDSVLPGGGAKALEALTHLPGGRVWMTPFERKESFVRGSVLAKPFEPMTLHKILLAADAAA